MTAGVAGAGGPAVPNIRANTEPARAIGLDHHPARRPRPGVGSGRNRPLSGEKLPGTGCRGSTSGLSRPTSFCPGAGPARRAGADRCPAQSEGVTIRVPGAVGLPRVRRGYPQSTAS